MSLKYDMRIVRRLESIQPIQYQYRRHGQFHRMDGPAIIVPNTESTYWVQYNNYHRTNGPAIIRKDKSFVYCNRGIAR